MIPTINFDHTDENGQDAWKIRADDRPVGEVYVGFDTDEEPAQPYINSISVVEEYRHQGIGKQVVQLLADHYGSLTSDPGGNTTSEAHSMWRSVPGARQITVSPYGKEIQIWKIGGKLLEMSRTSQPASNEQKIRMRELLNRGYNHMEAAEMLGLVYMPTGKLVQKQGTKKQAYISSPNGELNITIVRNERPEVTLTLDLGIPNFTVFSLKFPCVEDSPQGMQEMVVEGIRALLDEVTSFMLSMNYDQEVAVKLYAAVLQCFKGMTNESDAQSQFSDVSRDPTIKTYEGTFKMPIDFINQTQEKVVTGGSGKNIRRSPAVRHLELTTSRPEKNDLGDVARIIRQYRNRSLKQQPKPLYVIVYDQAADQLGLCRSVTLSRTSYSRC